jgi:hypothetical protein
LSALPPACLKEFSEPAAGILRKAERTTPAAYATDKVLNSFERRDALFLMLNPPGHCFAENM